MKKLLMVFAFIFIAGIGTVYADDLDVKVICPASVSSGQSLDVMVQPQNWDCKHSVDLTGQQIMKLLVGNSAGTLGGAGLWGPYPQNIVNLVLPPANCRNGTPGTVDPFPVTIISEVPASLNGTMAFANVNVVFDATSEIGGGGCLVTVVAPPAQ